jgi:hypothetical protein
MSVELSSPNQLYVEGIVFVEAGLVETCKIDVGGGPVNTLHQIDSRRVCALRISPQSVLFSVCKTNSTTRIKTPETPAS